MNKGIKLIMLLATAIGAANLSPLARAQTHETDRAELASAALPAGAGDSLSAMPSAASPLTSASPRPSPGAVRAEVLRQLEQTEADSSMARLGAIYETH